MSAFIITLLLLVGLGIWFGSQADAHQLNQGNPSGSPQTHSYILHPPVDDLPSLTFKSPYNTLSSGQKDDLKKALPRLSFTLRRPNENSGSSVSYVPSQFLVVSDQPRLEFEVRGGRWSDENDGSGRDFYDRQNGNPGFVSGAARAKGFGSPVYYEVYQLTNGLAQDGANQKIDPDNGGSLANAQNTSGRLGVINPRDPNIFPAVDKNPNSNGVGVNDCSSTSNSPCWREFNVNQGGGSITLNGSQQDSCAKFKGTANRCLDTTGTGVNPLDQTISGSQFGVVKDQKFQSPYYTNLNGYYVFLVKMVHFQDLDHGYVTRYSKINKDKTDEVEPGEQDDPEGTAYGCVFSYDSRGSGANRNNAKTGETNFVRCPTAIRYAAKAYYDNHPILPDEQKNASRLLEDGFFLRAMNDFSTQGALNGNFGHQYIASAPVNLAFNMDWGPPTVPNTVPQPQEWNDIYIQPYRGLHFQSGGTTCRNDSYETKAAGFSPKISNADWDVKRSGEGTEGAGVPLPNNVDIGAVVERTNGGARKGVAQGQISSSWQDDIWNIKLNNPAGNDGFNQSYQGYEMQYGGDSQSILEISGWNHSNDLLVGGSPFTWGQWPYCTPTVTQNTPDPPPFVYNGYDATTPITNGVKSQLKFGFTFQSYADASSARWQVELTDPSNNVVKTATGTVPNVQKGATTAPTGGAPLIEAGDLPTLPPNQNYRWRACVTTVTGASSPQSDPVNWGCSGDTQFTINKGPTPTYSAPAASLQYKCTQSMAGTLTDPEGTAKVLGQYQFDWTDASGNSNQVLSAFAGPKASGSSFTASEVNVSSWTINGNQQAVPNKTMLEFYRDTIPGGVNVTWALRGFDTYGASDVLDPFARAVATFLGGPVNLNTDVAQSGWLPPTGLKWGPYVSQVTHKNSASEFESASKKEFLDLNGNVITTVADGQTVQVRTTVTNGGETPAKYYAIKDYLGALRDFEKPTNVNVKTGSGATVVVPASQIASVVADRNDPDNLANESGKGDQSVPDPSTLPSGDPFFQSTDYRNGAWRIDLGANGGAYLPAGELAPGQSVVITYQARANRNQKVTNGIEEPNPGGGDFTRKLTPTDTHFWIRYQEDYCDDTNRVGKSIDKSNGTVQAPFLRTQRGSVGSNGGIFGYDALTGEENATFLVQANGALSHFTSTIDPGKINPLQNYTSQQNACTNVTGVKSGGIDWRTDMIKNIVKLQSGSKNGNTEIQNQLLNPSNAKFGQLNPSGQPNVWVWNGDLNITSAVPFKGVGTLLVLGNLTISSNLTYAADSNGVNSLGVIVAPGTTIVGSNLTIAPSVTNIVGTYYVLDADTSLDGQGCPKNIDFIKTNKGRIKTGASTLALNIQGALVAGAFDFERYFINPTDTESDPAENVYYDGRVLANTPPGFGTFRNTASWYEIAP